ncbi:MAG: VOC family protein [Gemmatimonadetes bacterium]|nr:VOC family protein [Gemmatimonadota bacterium]
MPPQRRCRPPVALDNVRRPPCCRSAVDSLVELLEPHLPDSPIAKFVDKKGPGIHHVCFTVDDLDGTLAKAKAAGIVLIDDTPRIGAEGKRIAFLHPKSTGGVLIELSEY